MKKLITLAALSLFPFIVQAQGLDDCSGPMHAAIDTTAAADVTIVAAVTGKKIRVLSYALNNTTLQGVGWESGTGGTMLSGRMIYAAGETVVANCPHGCFETAAGSLLNLEQGGATVMDGHITYALCN